jgi:hypothetical protein
MSKFVNTREIFGAGSFIRMQEKACPYVRATIIRCDKASIKLMFFQ